MKFSEFIQISTSIALVKFGTL